MKKNSEEKVFEIKRLQLVEWLKTNGSLKSKLIEQAFLKVPRECFVPESMREHAFADDALPVMKGQTISQPSTIAIMLELLELRNGLKVLEVGSGTGYVLALLKECVGIAGKVFGIELVPELVEFAKANLERAGVERIKLVCGDGSKGLQEEKPFDRILVSCACPFVPKALFEQLAENGIIVAPVGDAFTQQMQVLKKIKGKLLKQTAPGFFVFVPLKQKN